jgi:hypothetical protein
MTYILGLAGAVAAIILFVWLVGWSTNWEG